jgi:hypothetical protein
MPSVLNPQTDHGIYFALIYNKAPLVQNKRVQQHRQSNSPAADVLELTQSTTIRSIRNCPLSLAVLLLCHYLCLSYSLYNGRCNCARSRCHFYEFLYIQGSPALYIIPIRTYTHSSSGGKTNITRALIQVWRHPIRRKHSDCWH